MSEENKYLIESYYFDFKSFEIQNLIQSFNYTLEDQRSLSVAVYTAIRDGWKYDPYSIRNPKSSTVMIR